MRKTLYALVLMLLASSAYAQNPPGAFNTDRTVDGETVNFTGGTPPFRAHEETSPGVWTLRDTGNAGEMFIVVTSLPPNTCKFYNFVGAGAAPGSGLRHPVCSAAFSDGPFSDVNSGHWAVWQIAWMKDAGITNGCGNNNYCPDDGVTRAQMAVFMCNLANVLEPGTCTP